MRSISQIVEQFKENWLAEIDPAAIEQACRENGCRWRDRGFTPVVTVQVFLLQVRRGKRWMSGGSVSSMPCAGCKPPSRASRWAIWSSIPTAPIASNPASANAAPSPIP